MEIPAQGYCKKEETPEIVPQFRFEEMPGGYVNNQEEYIDEISEESDEEKDVLFESPNQRSQRQSRLTELQMSSAEEQLQAIRDLPYVQTLHDTLQTHANRIQNLEEELERANIVIQRQQSSLHSNQKLLEEKTNELQAANTFLCQTDSFARADIIELAEELNYEIQQVASLISNTYGAFESRHLLRSEADMAFRAQEKIAGTSSFSLRKTVQHSTITRYKEHRAAWIGIMIQALLVELICCEVLKKDWSVTNTTLESALSLVYKRIVKGNSAIRSIAGKWRTITHAVSQEAYPVQQLTNQSLMRTRLVLIAFGVTNLPSKGDYVERFRGDMEPVITSAFKLNTAIKQNISSCWIRPWIAKPGFPFKSQAMVDTNPPASQSDEYSGAVFASVSLGLMQSKNTGKDSQILLKPGVILDLLHTLEVESEVGEIDRLFLDGGGRG